MLLKGAFKNSSVFIQILLFLTIISVGIIVCGLISQILVVMRFGSSPEMIQQVLHNIANYPDLLRGMQFFQVIGIFIFPAIICAWLFSDDYKSYLKVDAPINISIAGLTILSMLIIIPFINWTHAINQQITFPDWMKGIEEWMLKQEEAGAQLTEKMLYAKTIGDLFLNIIIVCVLTGIGEEFVFRGVLQNIFGKGIKNPHLVIWLVAIIFSAMHFLFYGFVPRLLLGAYFGYLLWYTKNMWMPVLAHLTNNLISVITFYIFQDNPDAGKEIDMLGSGSTWWISMVSLVLFIFAFIQIRKQSISQDSSS